MSNSKATLVGTLALAAMAAVAPAQVLYNRFGMPDIDQRWADLPNDGKYYCAPTSNYNLMRYMDAHGVPNMMNGFSFNPELDLLVLGILHGTDPYKGGPARPGFDLIADRIGARAGNPLVFGYIHGPTSEWGVNRMRSVMASGSLAVLAYGKYVLTDIPTIGKYWVRSGGHVTTLIGYDFQSNPVKIFVRDPWTHENPANLNAQSDYYTDGIAVRNATLTTSNYGKVTHAIQDATEPGIRRMYDGLYQFMPATGGWSNDSVLEANRNFAAYRAIPASWRENRKYKGDEVTVRMPFRFEDEGMPETFTFRPREELVDWTPDLGNVGAVYATKLGRIFRVDLVTGEHKLLHVVKGARKVMIGGSRMETYVLASDREGDILVQIAGDGSVRKRTRLPYRVAGMEHDPVTGGPALPSANYGKMALFDEDLNPQGDMLLPGIPDGLGDVIFRIVPGDGSVLLARKGGSGFSRVGRRAATDNSFISFRTVYGLESIAPAGDGRFIVQDGDRLFTIDGAGSPVYSQFDGILGVAGEFRMARPHIAATPGFDSEPGWENIEVD